jgi:hypothetical protein
MSGPGKEMGFGDGCEHLEFASPLLCLNLVGGGVHEGRPWPLYTQKYWKRNTRGMESIDLAPELSYC